jgi:chemotaxis protein methyltransferase CheR
MLDLKTHPARGGPYTITEAEFEIFRALIREQTGIVLSDRKRQLICTRLSGRLRHYGYTSFQQYHDHLMREDPEGAELRCMLNAMTTNKTSFFREEHHFSFLEERVLPSVSRRGERLGTAVPLRLWSAACSTGEEPYSIAMTLRREPMPPYIRDVRILASDIDTDVLAFAERAIYPEDRVGKIPPALLRRSFLRGRGQNEGTYRVRPELRQLVTFRRINFQDPSWPISAVFDCIFCRNVVIYFDKETQERLMHRLLNYLRPGGFLFLGHSESMLGMKVGLNCLGKTMYQKPAEPGEESLEEIS